MSIHGEFFSAADFDPKVGQTDLVFDVQSWFISTCRSVRARLQVSVCSGHHGILIVCLIFICSNLALRAV